MSVMSTRHSSHSVSPIPAAAAAGSGQIACNRCVFYSEFGSGCLGARQWPLSSTRSTQKEPHGGLCTVTARECRLWRFINHRYFRYDVLGI